MLRTDSIEAGDEPPPRIALEDRPSPPPPPPPLGSESEERGKGNVIEDDKPPPPMGTEAIEEGDDASGD